MKIERVRIQNFRSIKDMTVELDDLTILIGANGTGKTTVLDALGLFVSRHTSLTHDDFFFRSRSIKVTLYIRPDGHSIPSRFVLNGTAELQKNLRRNNSTDGKRLWAAVMCNRDFDVVRGIMPTGEKKSAIKKLRQAYPDFPPYAAKRGWEGRFAEYEHRLSHDPKYSDKYYKDFVNVPKDEIDLSKILEVVMVPAARDASADEKEGVDSYLPRLMDLAIRSAQKNDKELREITDARDRAHSKYIESIGDTVRNLNKRLDRHSARYMTWVRFTIEQENPAQPPASPSATIRVRDGDFIASIGRAGSGARRVYLLSLLDTIASMLKEGREGDEGAGEFPTRLIAIDEPELYQHPQRQQRILRSLMDIVEGDPAVRIVCSTHSPYFVWLKRIHSLRLLRRVKGDRVRSVTPERLARLMLPKKRAAGDGGAGELAKWLDMSATRWVTEGFFASLVVITEGQGDRSMLLATARAMGVDLARHEITIVPATSVSNVEKFAKLFGEFKIPVYLVWDRDGRWDSGADDAHGNDSRLASVASGGTFGGSLRKTTIVDSFACIEDNLTVALSRDLQGCEGVLEGTAEYAGLKGAIEQDELSSRWKSQKCHKCGAPRDVSTGHRASHKAQKDFLNNRLNVISMLGAVREGGGSEMLETFTTARVVRRIEEAGKAIAEDLARQAAEAAAGREPDDRRADSAGPNYGNRKAARANRRGKLAKGKGPGRAK